MEILNARVMALGYALIDAWKNTEEGDSLSITKEDGIAKRTDERVDVQLIQHILNHIAESK